MLAIAATFHLFFDVWFQFVLFRPHLQAPGIGVATATFGGLVSWGPQVKGSVVLQITTNSPGKAPETCWKMTLF